MELSRNSSLLQLGVTPGQFAGPTPEMYVLHCGKVGSMRQIGEKGLMGSLRPDMIFGRLLYDGSISNKNIFSNLT